MRARRLPPRAGRQPTVRQEVQRSDPVEATTGRAPEPFSGSAFVLQTGTRLGAHCSGGRSKLKPLLNAENAGLRHSRAARDALVSHGIAGDRLKMATFGAELAGAEAIEPVGQERDRRVEIWLIRE